MHINSVYPFFTIVWNAVYNIKERGLTPFNEAILKEGICIVWRSILANEYPREGTGGV